MRRVDSQSGDVVTLGACYLLAVACYARLRTRALGVLIVEDPHSQGALVPNQSVMPAVLSTAGRSCYLRVEVLAGN